MTKTYTNHLNDQNCSLTEDTDGPAELSTKDQRFYTAISAKLNLIQILPKRETVLKIITYSRTIK